ncbi:nucleoprotein [Aphelenchoides bicaudatus]|nr:nucleoprotein [Aphelenchoides bicaudatus]
MASFSLKRDRLRVVFGQNPPDAYGSCRKFPTLNPTVDCLYPGFTTEIISMLADSAHFFLEPVIIHADVGEVNWGTYNNGSFTGVLGMLEQYKADTACILFQYVEERDVFFDYSEAVTFIRNVYITKPKVKNVGMALWNAFKPYQPTVWLCLISAFIIHCVFAVLVAKAERCLNMEQHFMPFYKCWQYLRMQVHQSPDLFIPFRLISGNFNFMFYSLVQATLFTALYSGILLFALIRGEETQPWKNVDTMIEMVRSGDYKFVVDRFNYEASWFFKEIVRSNTPHTRKIFEAVQRNPVLITNSVEEAFDVVDRGGFIFPTQEDSHAMFTFLVTNNVSFVLEDLVKPAYFLFSDKNPLLKRWNTAIRANDAFIRRTIHKYFHNHIKTGKIPKCPTLESEISEASKPLNITSTFGIFLILIVGLAISILSFLMEWIFKFLIRKIQTLPRPDEQRHLSEPWTTLHKAQSFYVESPPIFIVGQKSFIPRWVYTVMDKKKL